MGIEFTNEEISFLNNELALNIYMNRLQYLSKVNSKNKEVLLKNIEIAKSI